jgi:hypothetical protein
MSKIDPVTPAPSTYGKRREINRELSTVELSLVTGGGELASVLKLGAKWGALGAGNPDAGWVCGDGKCYYNVYGGAN